MGQHQLRHRRTIAAAAVVSQDIDEEGIGSRLHGEKLLIAFIPGKGLLQGFCILTDSLLIINMKGGGILFHDPLHQFFCHKCFFHKFLHSSNLFKFLLLFRNWAPSTSDLYV